MVKFTVKNMQVGHPKITNNEKKFDGWKNIFFIFNVFNTAKKNFSDKYRVDTKIRKNKRC